jgi:hypothetical protein
VELVDEEPEVVPLEDEGVVLDDCACKLSAAAKSADVPHVINFPRLFMCDVVDECRRSPALLRIAQGRRADEDRGAPRMIH